MFYEITAPNHADELVRHVAENSNTQQRILLVRADRKAAAVSLARAMHRALPDWETTDRLPFPYAVPGSSEQLEASLVWHMMRGARDEDDAPLSSRPFRAPHHTCSTAALVGGGSSPRPGELSLAHGGTLLLDAWGEFRVATADAIRATLDTCVAEFTSCGQLVRLPARPRFVIGTVDAFEGHPREQMRFVQNLARRSIWDLVVRVAWSASL